MNKISEKIRAAIIVISIIVFMVTIVSGVFYLENQQRVSAVDLELVHQWTKEFPDLTVVVQACIKRDKDITQECFKHIEHLHRLAWIQNTLMGQEQR